MAKNSCFFFFMGVFGLVLAFVCVCMCVCLDWDVASSVTEPNLATQNFKV